MSGVYGVFLGPLAAGIIARQNFIRLGDRKKSWWMLIAAFFFSVILLVVSSRLDPGNISGFKYLYHSLVGAFFTLFQLREFEIWKKKHQDLKKPENGWLAFVWGILGLLLSFLLAPCITAILMLIY